MVKQIAFVVIILCSMVYTLNTNSMAAEKIINIPIGTRFEKVGDFENLKLPDGSRIEMKTISIYDNVPIRDNIFGECEIRFYDQTGKVQEGKGYLIIDPAKGKLEGKKIKVPFDIKFLPSR